MKRRRFLSSMAVMVPAAIISSEFLLSSCNSDVTEEFSFNEEGIRLLDEIGETIIPATADSPGAKAAKVGEFMKVYVTDCYDKQDQATFTEGIVTIKKMCKSKYGKEFVKLSTGQKIELLGLLENEAAAPGKTNEKTAANGDAVQTGRAQENNKASENSKHYYPMIKELTLLGYFTSEPGATRALRYVQTPGYYKGEIPYKPGDKTWAT